jgi:sorting nexin-1/2
LLTGLRDKLVEKYLQNGRIIPPAPDKSIIGMTKIKISKEEDNTDQSGTGTGTVNCAVEQHNKICS